MNSLSWMIYFAGVADSVSGVFRGIGIAAAIASAATCLLAGFLNFDTPLILSRDDREAVERRWERNKQLANKAIILLPCVAITTALFASFIPSSKTIYAIAASEMGEDVLKSKTGSKAIKALDAWLDRQISPVRK